ncbi:MAG: GGDEF domain-containing protein [Treponema sp.]|jgi:diguanylate cyclase (GGDEF)-like protein|nr:GGDEF domain-containing protein [Treponema sp.]
MFIRKKAELYKKNIIKKLSFSDIFEVKIIFIIIITSVIVSGTTFTIISARSRQALVELLKIRTEIILSYTEAFIDKETFSLINTAEDVEMPLYQETRQTLNQIRKMTSLKYLYTIKRNDQGTLIYVIDGQDSEAPGFCYPGQPLEKRLQKSTELALEGQRIFGDTIQDTSYGPVYITLWPFFDQDRVIGGIVLEYDAASLYYLDHSSIFLFILVFFLLILLFSILFSVFFKGLARPFHKKMTYTDILTGLNNRTAFELDRKKIQDNLKNHLPLVMLMFDLNNLKEVNDTLGHSKGDLYLVTAGQLIQKFFGDLGECYRIGGDEFCVISTGHDPEILRHVMEQDFAEETERNRGIIKSNGIEYFAIAYGMAVYDKNIHRDLYEVFVLADERMYAKKRQMKMKSKEV